MSCNWTNRFDFRQIFTLVGALVIIIYSSPLVVVVLCVVGYGYYNLQTFYRQSSRDMRRLESTYSSPVGTLLMDCLANAPVIRAHQVQSVFDTEFSKALDKVRKASWRGKTRRYCGGFSHFVCVFS